MREEPSYATIAVTGFLSPVKPTFAAVKVQSVILIVVSVVLPSFPGVTVNYPASYTPEN